MEGVEQENKNNMSVIALADFIHERGSGSGVGKVHIFTRVVTQVNETPYIQCVEISAHLKEPSGCKNRLRRPTFAKYLKAFANLRLEGTHKIIYEAISCTAIVIYSIKLFLLSGLNFASCRRR